MTKDSKQSKGSYFYPDIVVVCDEPKFHDQRKDVLLNPSVVIEVLSPETEKFDRGETFIRYQTWNPALIDYLSVSQDRLQIEQFVRKETGNGWDYQRRVGLHAVMVFESPECRLNLAELYERVSFEKEETE